MELVVIKSDNSNRNVPSEEIQAIVAQINKEREEAEAAKKKILSNLIFTPLTRINLILQTSFLSALSGN